MGDGVASLHGDKRGRMRHLAGQTAIKESKSAPGSSLASEADRSQALIANPLEQ